ncbi:TetR/AcrR family transcriptional regulator [Celeribacter indicus]|uniref:Transcriptional regulator, TetR family protein n=1 Tax=Celeribacter indicus TaxID=1208324 RepID=A0A0B5E021_9RHOB|nr:TetR/AcrR family transcriptional regulator [Celeribacter indicus]AJE48604.1 transcriptional regulator, TetR family protein [Celeribacter indicus]SDX09521.1 transcriptional regulator, TetR family [Celeribacter indicus]
MTKAKSRRVGRPEGQRNLADLILDRAEILFAEQGYSGTTLRQVADAADVTSAMTAYYFRNKENLFREVFLRRGLDVAQQRMDRLADLGETGGVSIEALVRAFLEPSSKLRKSAQGRAFLRLHARLHMEPEPLSYALRREVYDLSTRAYVEAISALLPDQPERRIYQKMSLMVGAYLYAFSDTNRLKELAMAEDATDDLLETTVAFGVGGFLA